MNLENKVSNNINPNKVSGFLGSSPSDKSNKKYKLILLIGIPVIFIFLIMSFLLLSRGSSSSPSSSTSPTRDFVPLPSRSRQWVLPAGKVDLTNINDQNSVLISEKLDFIEAFSTKIKEIENLYMELYEDLVDLYIKYHRNSAKKITCLADVNTNIGYRKYWFLNRPDIEAILTNEAIDELKRRIETFVTKAKGILDAYKKEKCNKLKLVDIPIFDATTVTPDDIYISELRGSISELLQKANKRLKKHIFADPEVNAQMQKMEKMDRAKASEFEKSALVFSVQRELKDKNGDNLRSSSIGDREFMDKFFDGTNRGGVTFEEIRRNSYSPPPVDWTCLNYDSERDLSICLEPEIAAGGPKRPFEISVSKLEIDHSVLNQNNNITESFIKQLDVVLQDPTLILKDFVYRMEYGEIASIYQDLKEIDFAKSTTEILEGLSKVEKTKKSKYKIKHTSIKSLGFIEDLIKSRRNCSNNPMVMWRNSIKVDQFSGMGIVEPRSREHVNIQQIQLRALYSQVEKFFKKNNIDLNALVSMDDKNYSMKPGDASIIDHGISKAVQDESDRILELRNKNNYKHHVSEFIKLCSRTNGLIVNMQTLVAESKDNDKLRNPAREIVKSVVQSAKDYVLCIILS